MHMETICFSSVSMPAKMNPKLSPSNLQMWGILKLKQQSPITKGVMSGLRSDYNDDVFDKLAYQSADLFM